jgi:hypothetical protein
MVRERPSVISTDDDDLRLERYLPEVERALRRPARAVFAFDHNVRSAGARPMVDLAFAVPSTWRTTTTPKSPAPRRVREISKPAGAPIDRPRRRARERAVADPAAGKTSR